MSDSAVQKDPWHSGAATDPWQNGATDPWANADPWSSKSSTRPREASPPAKAPEDKQFNVPSPDPFQNSDPWSSSAVQRPSPAKAPDLSAEACPPPTQGKEEDAWSSFQPGVAPQTTEADELEDEYNENGVSEFFEQVVGYSREEYIRKHIDYNFQELVRIMELSDVDLYRLGRRHFQEQAEYLRKLSRDEEGLMKIARKSAGPRGGILGGLDFGRGEERHWWWDDEEIEENPFWWRGEVEQLCFDLPMTPSHELTRGAPGTCQWWDVEKLAESDYFVAIAKPSGMFVVTDQRGLWEVSPTNFIHVSHRRFEMPSSSEPRQRGICHRLDSHTSGVQIFGKSWEAFRHFTVQNSAHRMQKEYVCLVCGRMGGQGMPDNGIIDVPMKKWQDFTRREFGSVVSVRCGLPAVSKYKVLRQWKVPGEGKLKFWGEDRWFSLVHLRILTGRTHQIRVHMGFLGHPLVGDIKYNPKYVEQDYALVPRIFLHCLRMEFEDMDGTTFVAASQMAADLQVALNRVQRLAVETTDGCGNPCTGPPCGPAGLSGFPGLAGLMEQSAPSTAAEDKKVISGQESSNNGVRENGRNNGQGDECPRIPEPLIHKSLVDGEVEVARCSLHSRGKRRALYWRLTRPEESDLTQPESREPATWGPKMLWIPSELLQYQPQQEAAANGKPEGAEEALGAGSPDQEDDEAVLSKELGSGWGAHGSEWAWAHDGSRQNGWLRLHRGGTLTSKWGAGTWELLPTSDAWPEEFPLLLVTFNLVEHALRLTLGGSGGGDTTGDASAGTCDIASASFDVVCKRRLALDKGVAEDLQASKAGALEKDPRDPKTLRCCPTKGWPCIGAANLFSSTPAPRP